MQIVFLCLILNHFRLGCSGCNIMDGGVSPQGQPLKIEIAKRSRRPPKPNHMPAPIKSILRNPFLRFRTIVFNIKKGILKLFSDTPGTLGHVFSLLASRSTLHPSRFLLPAPRFTLVEGLPEAVRHSQYSYYDEVESDHVIQKPWHQQDQNSRNQSDHRFVWYVRKVHCTSPLQKSKLFIIC